MNPIVSPLFYFVIVGTPFVVVATWLAAMRNTMALDNWRKLVWASGLCMASVNVVVFYGSLVAVNADLMKWEARDVLLGNCIVLGPISLVTALFGMGLVPSTTRCQRHNDDPDVGSNRISLTRSDLEGATA